MPNLPGSTLAMDEVMFEDMLYSPDLQVTLRLMESR
jgi:hypothetical protein